MNKKKHKPEYCIEKVNLQLKKLLNEENIISMQKCYLFTQLKIYKDLYNTLEQKYKNLEIENCKLLKKHIDDNKICNKENITNSNYELDDSVNNIENIVNNYKINIKEQYDGEYESVSELISNLRQILQERDKAIIELENKIIKLQIMSKTVQSTDANTEEETTRNDIINLKTKVEYSLIEKERLIINSNYKIIESKVKYEEFYKKYNNISENYNNTLLKLEELKNFVKEKDFKKNEQIRLLNEKIQNTKTHLEFLYNTINDFCKLNNEIKNQYVSICKLNTDLANKLKNYKLFENKENLCSGDEFYDTEISNLLEACDFLTQDNKNLQLEVNILERDRCCRNFKTDIFFKNNLYPPNDYYKFIDDIAKQKKVISDLSQELKAVTAEKNRLIRINVERMKISDKYKDELRIKNIENVCLEKKLEDMENMIKDMKNEIFDRLSTCNKQQFSTPFVTCTLCETNAKNIAISSCMHTFCDVCINTRIKLRDRKCPTCGISYNVSDVKRFFL